MKNVFELANKLGKKMNWCDFSMLKLSVMFATLFLVGIWDWFRGLVLSINPWTFLVVSILLSIPLLKKMFSK
jgi:hypothetical protein